MSYQATAATQWNVRTTERYFYLSMGIACALIVFLGFSPSYFLSSVMERPATAPPITLYIHLHAGIFTTWIALFITQTALVSADRRDIHRRLGVLGIAVAIALVTINMATVMEAIADSDRASTKAVPGFARLYVAISTSLLAAGYIAAGMYFRRNRDTHKRLMLLATIGMVGPAMNRIISYFDLTNLTGIDRGTLALSATLSLYGVCVANDLTRRRRVHPVYLIGTALALAIVSTPSRLMIVESEAWQRFAKWVIG